jgi:hypothetical protein
LWITYLLKDLDDLSTFYPQLIHRVIHTFSQAYPQSYPQIRG